MGPAPLERNAVSGKAESAKAAKREAPRGEGSRSSALEDAPRNEWFVCALITFVLLVVPELCPASSSSSPGDDRTSVILVIGAPGNAEYGTNFLGQAGRWQSACAQAGARLTTIGLGPCELTNDYEFLKQTLADEPKAGAGQLWLILIGHGTFDGNRAQLNLRGPDVSATDLAAWLHPFRRPLAIIDTTACSGPFLNALSATNRVIVTATRSGNEQSFTRFGQYFAEALTDPQADVDHDGQISLLEAFLTASHQVIEFYKLQGRLVTEHPLLDDNGDGLGTPADWFRGLRPVKQPKAGEAADGLLAQQFRLIPSPDERNFTPEQMTQRDGLEKAVLLLREKKGRMPENDYYRDLETLLLQLARCYASNATSHAAPAK